jgi:hypothetical protein
MNMKRFVDITKKIDRFLMIEKLVKDDSAKETIGTIKGVGKYIGTEIEDDRGKWNDNFSVRDGFYVIHVGKKHHIYKLGK